MKRSEKQPFPGWNIAIDAGPFDRSDESAYIETQRCAAGHKAMWHESWGGLPAEEFLVKIDPLLKGLNARPTLKPSHQTSLGN